MTHTSRIRSRTRPTRVLLAALIAVTTGLGGTGCLPDAIDGQQERVDAEPALDLTWFETTSPPDVVDAALVAMAQLGSVRLRQDAENPGEGDPVVSKDLRLAVGDGIGDAVDGDCSGTLQLPSWSEPAELLVEDDLGVFRGGEAFWLGFGGDLGDAPDANAQLAASYADRWTTVPGLATLCDFTEFLDPVASMVGDEDVVKAGLGDVAGVPAGRVVATGKRRTVTAWVQVAEPHLVLRIRVEQGDPTDPDADVTVTTFSEPDAALDVDFPEPDEIEAFVLPTL